MSEESIFYSAHTTLFHATAYKEMKTNTGNLNIIQECIRGSRTAQKQLYEMYKVKMYTLCLRYMSNTHDAEDRMQEAWVKVFKQLETFDSNKGTFYGWIRKVFVNTNLEFLRKRKLRFDELSSDIHSRNEDPKVYAQMGLQELVNLMQSLPTGYRSVFNLYAIEGYTHKEIGELLGISQSTSKTQYMRAKQLLRVKVTDLELV